MQEHGVQHARDRLGIKDSCTCDEMKKDGAGVWVTGKKRQRRDGGLKGATEGWRVEGMEGWRDGGMEVKEPEMHQFVSELLFLLALCQ